MVLCSLKHLFIQDKKWTKKAQGKVSQCNSKVGLMAGFIEMINVE